MGGDERGRKKWGEEAEAAEEEEGEKKDGKDTIQLASPARTPSSGTIAGYLGLIRDERHGG